MASLFSVASEATPQRYFWHRMTSSLYLGHVSWWVRRPIAHSRDIRMAAALSRGALRWIRLLASQRVVWGCCHAARVRLPPPEEYDREGVFYVCRFPTHQAFNHGTITPRASRLALTSLAATRSPSPALPNTHPAVVSSHPPAFASQTPRRRTLTCSRSSFQPHHRWYTPRPERRRPT